MKEKKQKIVDGVTIKYHANGKTIWSKGKILDGKPEGYWEWYRIDGTIKRSGHFENGVPMTHVIIMGIIGTIVSILGSFAMWDLAVVWYNIAIILIALPSAIVGGKLYLKNHK